jgi:hypothetical protein
MPETPQTKKAYTQRINRMIRIKKDVKRYMIEKYGWNGVCGYHSNKYLISEAYRYAVEGCNKKLRNYKRQRRKLDKKQQIVTEIGSAVEEFMGVNIRMYAYVKNSPNHFLGRYIFSKYVLENVPKVNGKHIRNYLDNKNHIHVSNPTQWRRRLTKSFTKYPERKKLYHDFLNFIKTKNISHE